MKSSFLLKIFSPVLLIFSLTITNQAQAENNAQDNNNTNTAQSHDISTNPRYIADFSDSSDYLEDRQNNMDSALEDHIDTEDIWDSNGNNILKEDATSVNVDDINLDTLINKGEIVFKDGNNLQSGENTTLKVAVLLPLTGKNARYGNDILSGMEKAVFKYNKPNISLQVYDTKSSVASTKTAYNKAKSFGAKMILGPLLARSVYAISDQAVADGIPLISFTNNTIIARKGVYVMGQLPEDSVTVSARHAFKSKFTNPKYPPKFAVVAPTGAYGDVLVTALSKTAKELHTTISRTLRYDHDSNMNQVAYSMAKNSNRLKKIDIDETSQVGEADSPTVTKPVSAPEPIIHTKDEYDILLIVGSKKYAQSLIVALPYYDLDLTKVQIIGTQRWYTSWVAKERTLSGAIFAASDDVPLRRFNDDFNKLYNHVPVSLASTGYDAYGMLATISENLNMTDMNKYITKTDGYNGIGGIFRFRENGKVQRSLAIYRIANHRFRKIHTSQNISN